MWTGKPGSLPQPIPDSQKSRCLAIHYGRVTKICMCLLRAGREESNSQVKHLATHGERMNNHDNINIHNSLTINGNQVVILFLYYYFNESAVLVYTFCGQIAHNRIPTKSCDQSRTCT